jgi:hypothetical protein
MDGGLEHTRTAGAMRSRADSVEGGGRRTPDAIYSDDAV